LFSDIIFLLDFNSLKRIDTAADVVQVSKALKVMIDHHPQPEQCADIIFSFPQKSSTAEIVWEFMKKLDTSKLDKRIAGYVFLGIVSDTGCFCFDSAGKETFSIVSEILDYNIDKSRIIEKLYQNFSENRTRLLGYLLHNKMKVFHAKKAAYITFTLREKELFAYRTGDHENFVNFPLSIKGIKFSAFFMENEDEIRVSLRSKGDYVNVNEIARKYFFGGGHKNAAGGKFKGSMEELEEFFSEKILKNL
jgi:phosphoesterase RecJ-like protein